MVSVEGGAGIDRAGPLDCVFKEGENIYNRRDGTNSVSLYLTEFSLNSMTLSAQLLWLLILAIPIASVAWTITHEELFNEPRKWCEKRSQECRTLIQRKFFYLFTCEYCFSHWVTAFFLFITRFKLLFSDWRGYLIAGFSLVWVANVYMSFFARIRLDVKRERVDDSNKPG